MSKNLLNKLFSEEKDMEHYNLLKVEVNKHKNTYINKENVNWLRKLFSKYNIIDETYVRTIYRYLTTLITDIENINKDFKKDLLK